MIGMSVIDGCEIFLNRLSVAGALLVFSSALAQSQSPSTVPPNDPVYEFVDRLLSAGLVDRLIVGQRPMSRREIARILNEARGRLPAPTADSSWLSRSLERYRAFYSVRDSTRSAWYPRVRKLGFQFQLANSPGRGIPGDASGSIDVTVNPLVANQMGRGTSRHTSGISWGVAEISPTDRLSLVGATLTDFGDPSVSPGDLSPSSRVRSVLEQLYARGLFANVGVTVGRDYVFLGQGAKAGLTNSLNAGALDMVRLASDAPFTLPWLLRHAGPVQATFFLADLGKSQNFPHARLAGYKASARPSKYFEIGATVADQVGGQGAPGGTFRDKAVDAFPLIDALILHRNFAFSNKFVGMDARLTIPGARGLQAYLEGVFDDFDLRRARSVFTEDAGYIWGASLDCFRECGPAKVTAEYHATGVRYYTHSVFTSGHTLNGQFLGNSLGPRGKAAYLTFDIDRLTHRFTLEAAHEIRSGDKYSAASTQPNDADFRFTIYEHNPAERRWRSVVTATRGDATSMATQRLSVGVERVEHFNFQPGNWRTNGLLQVGVEFKLPSGFPK